MDLSNKNIIITGAGKGIGRDTAYKLLKEGAFVYAVIKNKKDNLQFHNLKNFLIFNGSIEDISLISRILIKSIQINKPIHGLVNNAGIRLRKKFLNVKKREIQKVFNSNFFSNFFIMQKVAKYFIKNKIKGSVVNISSIVGQIGFNELSVYASSKGALASLTKSFAVEMAPYNIRANTVSPGFTKTSYYKKFKIKKKKVYNWTLSRIPMKRWGEASEISDLIIYLLSEKSSYITGENINIDGGWLNS